MHSLCSLQLAVLYLDPALLAGVLLRLKTSGRGRTIGISHQGWPLRWQEVLATELSCNAKWDIQVYSSLGNFTTESQKMSTRQWLPKVRPWSEAVARTLFLIKIGDKIYPLTLWPGMFSSFNQSLSLLFRIGRSQPTLCSGCKGVGVLFSWSGGALWQARHPANTLPWGCVESAEQHPQGPEFNIGGRTLLAFCVSWVIGWIRSKPKASTRYWQGDEKVKE